MNAKILELAKQAGFELWKDEPWNPGDVIDWSSRYDDEFVKFAELVVRECIDKVYNFTIHSKDVEQMVLKHFGVKNERGI